MHQMYKVFFKDRTVFLCNSCSNRQNTKSERFMMYENKNELFREINIFIKDDSINSLTIKSEDLSKLWKDFLGFFKLINAAGGLVSNDRNDLLLIRRNEVWDLPKGKAEKNESIEETALREVSEECGIENIRIISHIVSTYHSYELNGDMILKKTSWYRMSQHGNEKPVPQTNEGITEIKWVASSELSVFLKDTFPSIRDVFMKAGYSI